MAPSMHVLKLEPDQMTELRQMAADIGIPFGVYIKLILKQHIKTPFRIEVSPGKKSA